MNCDCLKKIDDRLEPENLQLEGVCWGMQSNTFGDLI